MAAIPADGTFGIGRVYSRMWRVMGPDFITILALIALFAVPERIAVHAVGYDSPILSSVDKVALAFCGFGLQLAIMHLALRRFAGQPASFGACVMKALATFVPAGVIYLVSMLPIALALLVVVAPGVMLLTSWAVILPVYLAEGGAMFASFGRSAALTRGYRWRILASMLLLGLLMVPVILALMPIWGIHGASAVKLFLDNNWLMRLIFNAAVGLLIASIYQELVGADRAA